MTMANHFISVTYYFIVGMRISKCIAEMAADASNSTGCIGSWLTIPTTNVVVSSATGSSFLVAVSAVAMIYHWNFG